MAPTSLLEEFPPVSTEAWNAAIARDLKDPDYESKLTWHIGEGLAVKPWYRAENLAGLACVDTAPGEFPYRRGARGTGDWRIREEIDATDAKAANGAACAAVAGGAEEIAFSRILVESALELELLLKNLAEIPVHFECADKRLIRLLAERVSTGASTAGISTGYDAQTSLDFAAETICSAPAGFVPFTIHSGRFEQAEASAPEETGLALAAGVDFLAAMEQRGVAADRAAAAIEFSFAVGPNYFIEIAKLRAFRMVWARAVESSGGTREAARARIAARTSRGNQSTNDSHMNALRATTEAMAAVLGGADAVVVPLFDACNKTPDEASRRLARNTQLILKHEACLGRVADAAGGSYYLETLTDLVAQEAWKIMQEIETRGGFRSAHRTEPALAGHREGRTA